MTDHEGLEPPKSPRLADPGAHQLVDSSDSEDQFTDAQSAPMSPRGASSPIPKTRVEKVDDSPSYGEVPGTEAYKLREEDAVPDEIAISGETPSHSRASSTVGTIPATLVEEAPGQIPRPRSADFTEKRKADASPDLVLNSDGEIKSIQGEDVSDAPSRSVIEPPSQNRDSTDDDADAEADGEDEEDEEEDEDEDAEADDFGDDFDDFEEGAADDDFDDFEDGFQQADTSAAALPVPQALPFPIPDFDGLDTDSILSITESYLAGLFPPEELDLPTYPPLPKDNSIFQTPRSASLWSQLVAPPPLAPPDWIRSRTRRLFLVSLGVPVDLDEILPASKQKKLVLPSLSVPAASPRTSSDSRSVSRLRTGEGNASSTSIDTQGKPSTSKRRRGPPPQPTFDLVAARHLCLTTDEALDGMTDEELKAHISRLEVMEGQAKEALEYWQKRTDEKIGDREAFEGVIENLVKHARKVRK